MSQMPVGKKLMMAFSGGLLLALGLSGYLRRASLRRPALPMFAPV
jgi:hypothetical protein